MIPCPYCERGFEKRAGLMRHVSASHCGPQEADLAHPPADAARVAAIEQIGEPIPVNPGGAIEPVIPVDPETWAEGLTDEQLAPGQERYVDPPIFNGYISLGQPAGGVIYGSTDQTIVAPPVHLTADVAPTAEQYTRIRALRRQGRPEAEAWMTVVGYPPPQRETPVEDSRPLRLQQVAFRVREGNTDHIDATWLLRLVEIGADAVAQLRYAVDSELLPLSWAYDDANPIVDRWNETIA